MVRGAARCPSSEAEMYGSKYAQVSALGSLVASAPQGFQCISIIGSSNGQRNCPLYGSCPL